MKNNEVIAIAAKVVEFARAAGFTDAHIEIQDEADDIYTSLEDVIANYNSEEFLELRVSIMLTDTLNVELELSDPDDEESDLVATYPN